MKEASERTDTAATRRTDAAQLWVRRTRNRLATGPRPFIRRRGNKPQEGTSPDDLRQAQSANGQATSGRTSVGWPGRPIPATFRPMPKRQKPEQSRVKTGAAAQAKTKQLEPQGKSRIVKPAQETAKWSERPGAIRRKGVNLLCAGAERKTSRTRTSRLKVEEGEATHKPLRLTP